MKRIMKHTGNVGSTTLTWRLRQAKKKKKRSGLLLAVGNKQAALRPRRARWRSARLFRREAWRQTWMRGAC